MEENKQELDYNFDSFAKESFIGQNLQLPSGKMGMNVKRDRIERWLQNPNSNYQQLQDYSRLSMTKQGIYFRVIKLLSTLMTYDYVLVPNISPDIVNKVKYKKKIKESFAKSSLFLQNLDVRKNAIRFTEDFLIDGECYYCKIQDGSGIIYQKIPNEYCLPFANENGVWKFVVDCSKLAGATDITIYPYELQKAMKMYNDNNLKKSLLNERYYLVKNGVCFSIMEEALHGYPPLAFMLDELLGLEEKKTLKDEIDTINNVKMIHNKIASDKDGVPLMDIGTAKKYNSAIKSNLDSTGLGKLVFSITNPFDSELLNLKTTSGDGTSEMVTKAITQVYSEVGLNENLFNCTSNSSEAIKRSIVSATTVVINLIFNKIKDYINSELQGIDSEIKMFAKIYDCNIYNRDDYRKTAKEGMLVGGSKMEYLCFTYTPLEANNLLNLENILGVSDLFIPLQTSYTMSSSDSDDNGRPSAEQMKEDGKEVSDVTENQVDNA